MIKFILRAFVFLILLGNFSTTLDAQNVGVNATGAVPNSSAGLDIDFTDKGVLIPRVSLTQTTSNAPIGAGITTSLLVYNTASVNDVTPGFYYWNGTIWVKFQASNTIDWNLLGNTGITQPAVPGTYGTSLIGATENFLGTTDNRDVVIGTNNIERVRIKQTTGNVGIGTAAPANTLQVIGNASIGSSSNNVTGTNSVAAGSGNTISNSYSFGAGGQGNTITGQNDIVGGYLSRVQGDHSIVAGYTDTTTSSATAVFGFGNKVSGFTGFAAGDRNKVTASNGAATGYNNNANGDGSIVAGQNNTAASYGEAVFGLNSTNYSALGTGGTFNAADRIFNVGNGVNSGARADAFTILKNGRVGINNAAPNGTAKLDITATDKGMLIPRVALTATNTAGPITRADGAAAATSDLAGSLLVYNTATAGTAPNDVTPGFYYWNGSIWVKIAILSDIAQDHDWYEVGTTTAPDAITDDMFHIGNIAIGKNTVGNASVDIENSANASTIELTNNSASLNSYGVLSNLSNSTNQTGLRSNITASNGNNTGVYTNITGFGTGPRYGIRNTLNNGSAIYGVHNTFVADLTTDQYGVFSTMNGSSTNNNYGVKNSILNGTGNKYGISNTLTGGSGLSIGIENTIANNGSAAYGSYNTLSGINGSGYGMYNSFDIPSTNVVTYV